MRSAAVAIPSKWVRRISYLYLLIPFLIFCLGYLRLELSLGLSALFIWLVMRNWKCTPFHDQAYRYSTGGLVASLIAVSLWVALSGIGGFTFQNADFHIRNAIFRDLINSSWPVRYYTNPTDPSAAYTLIYYVGFWLPAALIGKLAGWVAANVALYLWAVLGISMTLLLLAPKVKLRLQSLALLFISFSGMDVLGTLARIIGTPNTPNSLWPPILHLEWWASTFQYSSFTTQLFWVFNQAIPAWLCLALLYTAKGSRTTILVWSLCCFFAPLPGIGMFPYVLLRLLAQPLDSTVINAARRSPIIMNFMWRLRQGVRCLITSENLFGGLILGVSLMFFLQSSQSTVSASRIPSLGWVLYPAFVLFDGLTLWWLFRATCGNRPSWYLAGALLIAIPLIRIGASSDFCMRGSIPTLFMLLIWAAEAFSHSGTRIRPALILILCLGAITPLYEINRSIFRTASYNLSPPSTAEKLAGEAVNVYAPSSFEFDHPYTLTADSYKSLANVDPEQFRHLLADTDRSLFETYLSR